MSTQNGTGVHVFGNADIFGGKAFDVINWYGAQSYNSGAGDVLSHRSMGFENRIVALVPLGLSASGTYYALAAPNGPSLTSWHLRWFVLATGQEVFGGANLSSEVIQLMGIGI